MMNLFADITTSQIGAIIAVFTASLLAAFGIVVVRGTKISEFRQKWIDDQRQDIARLLSYSAQIAIDPNSKRDERLMEIDTSANRIKLRENPDNPEWVKVIDLIDELQKKLSSIPFREINVSNESNAIIIETQVRLKKEWSRIRYGEIGYKIFYYTVILYSVVLISILMALVLNKIFL